MLFCTAKVLTKRKQTKKYSDKMYRKISEVMNYCQLTLFCFQFVIYTSYFTYDVKASLVLPQFYDYFNG